jgi:hypothetical protein
MKPACRRQGSLFAAARSARLPPTHRLNDSPPFNTQPACFYLGGSRLQPRHINRPREARSFRGAFPASFRFARSELCRQPSANRSRAPRILY